MVITDDSLIINIKTYITGIGNGSRELYLVVQALGSSDFWKCFLNISSREGVFFFKRIKPQEYW